MSVLTLKLRVFWTLPIVQLFKENNEGVRGGRLGVRIATREKYRLFCKPSGSILGPTHPPTQWVRGPLMGTQRPRSDVILSTPCSAEMNDWSLTSTPPIYEGRGQLKCDGTYKETRFVFLK